MANVKISQLPSGTVPTDNDFAPIVDFETLTTTAVSLKNVASYVTGAIQNLTLNNITSSGVIYQTNAGISVDTNAVEATAFTFVGGASLLHTLGHAGVMIKSQPSRLANFGISAGSGSSNNPIIYLEGTGRNSAGKRIHFIGDDSAGSPDILAIGSANEANLAVVTKPLTINMSNGAIILSGTLNSAFSITGSGLLLDPLVVDANSDNVRLKIRSRSNVNQQMINLGDINDNTQAMIGVDGIGGASLYGSNKAVKIFAGTAGGGFGDFSIGTGSVFLGTYVERFGMRDVVGSINEAVFNGARKNFNFRVGGVNNNLFVCSASINQVIIGAIGSDLLKFAAGTLQFENASTIALASSTDTLDFAGGLFSLDTLNRRVAFGTTLPAVQVHLKTTSSVTTEVRIESANSAGSARLSIYDELANVTVLARSGQALASPGGNYQSSMGYLLNEGTFNYVSYKTTGIQSPTAHRFYTRNDSFDFTIAVQRLDIADESVTINPTKANQDFTVGSVNKINMLRIAGGNDFIGLGTYPSASVHMSGNVRIDGPLFGYSTAFVPLTGNYNISSVDNGKTLLVNSALTATVIIPTSLTGGYGISFVQQGSGTIVLSAAPGVTLVNRQQHTRTAGIYAMMSLLHLSGNFYVFSGDTAP